jgi:High potential iron-sulfur protein
MRKNIASLQSTEANMQRNISRRTIIKGGLIAGALLPAMSLVSRDAQAAPLPPLDPNDPTAKALGYVPDATKVDTAKYASFKPTQKCGTCAQYQGKPGETSAACTIFAGKSVPQNGWCQVWAQKS